VVFSYASDLGLSVSFDLAGYRVDPDRRISLDSHKSVGSHGYACGGRYNQAN